MFWRMDTAWESDVIVTNLLFLSSDRHHTSSGVSGPSSRPSTPPLTSTFSGKQLHFFSQRKTRKKWTDKRGKNTFAHHRRPHSQKESLQLMLPSACKINRKGFSGAVLLYSVSVVWGLSNEPRNSNWLLNFPWGRVKYLSLYLSAEKRDITPPRYSENVTSPDLVTSCS